MDTARNLKVISRGTWHSIYVPDGERAYKSKNADGATLRVRGEDALRAKLQELGYNSHPTFRYYEPA